jgi:hypothetical protein
MNQDDLRDDAKLLHAQIGKALDLIQKCLTDNNVALFPAICAMSIAVKSYKQHHPGAKEVLLGLDVVLDKVNEMPIPEIH